MRWRFCKFVMLIAFWFLPSHCSGQEVAKIVSGDRHYGAVVSSEISESSRAAADDLLSEGVAVVIVACSESDMDGNEQFEDLFSDVGERAQFMRIPATDPNSVFFVDYLPAYGHPASEERARIFINGEFVGHGESAISDAVEKIGNYPKPPTVIIRYGFFDETTGYDLYFGPGSEQPAAPIGDAAIDDGGVVYLLSSYSCKTFRRFDQSRRMKVKDLRN